MSDASVSGDECPQFGWQRFDDDRPAPIRFKSSHSTAASDQRAIEKQARNISWAACQAATGNASSSVAAGDKKVANVAGSHPTQRPGKKCASKKWAPLPPQKKHGGSSSSEEQQDHREAVAEWKPLNTSASVRRTYGDVELALMPTEEEHYEKKRPTLAKSFTGRFAKRASALMQDMRQKKMIESAASNTHQFLVFTKSRNCVEKMTAALERHQELTSSARYRALADQLRDPGRALMPLYRLCDVESVENFSRLEHLLVPIVQESRKRHFEERDMQKQADACETQEIYLKQARKIEEQLHVQFKKTVDSTTERMADAVSKCSEEYASVAEEIAAIKRDQKTRRAAFDEYNRDMGALKRREHHARNIIEGVEARQRELEEKHRRAIEELQSQLHKANNNCAQVLYQCEEKVNSSKSIMSRIEAKLEDRMLKYAQKMMFMRIQRQTREKSFQERSLELKKEKLLQETKRLRIACAKADHELQRARAVNQVLELRQQALEGEALFMELELRCREVKPKGLGIEHEEKGLFTLLIRELERQTRWLAERAQPWNFDRSTLKLTRQPPLASPLNLLSCARKLVLEWKHQEERALEIECARLRKLELESKKKEEDGVEDLEDADKSPSHPHSLANSAFAIKGQPNAVRAISGVGSGREAPYKTILALHTCVDPDKQLEQEALQDARKIFARDVNDLILEAVLKRGQLEQGLKKDDPICPRFLKEMSSLPATLGKVQRVSESWEMLQGSIEFDDDLQELPPRLDELIADLLDSRDVALACAHWVTEGARIPGVFSDVLVTEAAWLPRFCTSLTQRIGTIRGIVAMLEESSRKPSKLRKVAAATVQMMRQMKFLSNMQLLQLAEDWMLRIIRVLHDQLHRHLDSNSALRWYCGKFYGQGGTDLAAIRRGLYVLQCMYNAPQLRESGASERLLAGEVSAEIRRGLTKALRKNDAQAYESALLAFNVLETSTSEEPIGTDFPEGKGIDWDTIEDPPHVKRMSEAPNLIDLRGSISRIHHPGEVEHDPAIMETESQSSSDDEFQPVLQRLRSSLTGPMGSVLSEAVLLDPEHDIAHSDRASDVAPSPMSEHESSRPTISPPLSPTSVRESISDKRETLGSQSLVESLVPPAVAQEEVEKEKDDEKEEDEEEEEEAEKLSESGRGYMLRALSSLHALSRSSSASLSDGSGLSKSSRSSRSSKASGTSKSSKCSKRRSRASRSSQRASRKSANDESYSQSAFSLHSSHVTSHSKASSEQEAEDNEEKESEAQDDSLSPRALARATLYDIFARADQLLPRSLGQSPPAEGSHFAISSDDETPSKDKREIATKPVASPSPSKDDSKSVGLGLNINGHGSVGSPHHIDIARQKKAFQQAAGLTKYSHALATARQQAIKDRLRAEKLALREHGYISSGVSDPLLLHGVEGRSADSPSPEPNRNRKSSPSNGRGRTLVADCHDSDEAVPNDAIRRLRSKSRSRSKSLRRRELLPVTGFDLKGRPIAVAGSSENEGEDANLFSTFDKKSRKEIIEKLEHWMQSAEGSDISYASKIKAWFEDALADQFKIDSFSDSFRSDEKKSMQDVIVSAMSSDMLDAYREKDAIRTHMEDAILLAQLMKATQIQPLMAGPLLSDLRNDLRDDSDTSSKTEDLSPQTCERPYVLSKTDVSTTHLQPNIQQAQSPETVPWKKASTAVPMLRKKSGPACNSQSKQRDEKNDLVAVGSNGMNEVVNGPTPIFETDDLLKHIQRPAASMDWLDRMRVEHTDAHLSSIRNTSKDKSDAATHDLLRLPGLRTCPVERGGRSSNTVLTPKYSLQVRLTTKSGGFATPVPFAPPSQYLPSGPTSAKPDIDDFPFAQASEVSTVLQSGSVCGSPCTKVAGLGGEFCTGQDSALPGQVLKATPSLLRRLAVGTPSGQRDGVDNQRSQKRTPAKEALPRRRRLIYDAPPNGMSSHRST